jgi:class 3 adenylate cyclase
VKAGAGRFLAKGIPRAQYVELPGSDHLPWVGDVDSLTDDIEEFLTGSRAQSEPERLLANVLLTDIVDSTKRAPELGDRRWRAILDQHNAVVRAELNRFRGREVRTLGDGFLATFAGPAALVLHP